MRQHVSTLISALLFTSTSACDFERDFVAPGYYGAAAQAGRAATPPSSTVDGGPPMGSLPAAPSMPTPSMPTEPAEPTKPVEQPGSMPPAGGCDLSGRWLSTLHQVTDGLGQLQTNHKYIYYEIEQSGDTFSVTKGLQCMNDVIAEGDFAVTGDFSGAWPALQSNVVYAGRTGSSALVANGCKVEFAQLYTVYGASLPHYLDPALPLPTVEEMATDTTPGWEDWDGDGNPGITGVMSGTVTGKVFVASREWTSLSGTVPSVSDAFELPLMWNPEPNVMSFDGSPFLGSEAVRAADPTLHFGEFVRLKAEQATGTDEAICQSLRELAPTLTPRAAAL